MVGRQWAASSVFLACLIRGVAGHMSMYHPGMFAFNGFEGCVDNDCVYEQVTPLGPGWDFDAWWFRGPKYRGDKQMPDPKDAVELVPGKATTLEITCHKAWSTWGISPTEVGSELDACPGNAGAYHADHPGKVLNENLVAGCALGIVDTMKWKDVTMDNMVVFSVQEKCIFTRMTQFDVPASMPSCTGDFCICAWFWLPVTGQGNFYMTGFYCRVKDGSVEHVLGTPKAPVFCAEDTSKCVSGPKQPIFVYNKPQNIADFPWNDDIRPAYNTNFSFTPGAQDDAIVTNEDRGEINGKSSQKSDLEKTPSSEKSSKIESGGGVESGAESTESGEATSGGVEGKGSGGQTTEVKPTGSGGSISGQEITGDATDSSTTDSSSKPGGTMGVQPTISAAPTNDATMVTPAATTSTSALPSSPSAAETSSSSSESGFSLSSGNTTTYLIIGLVALLIIVAGIVSCVCIRMKYKRRKSHEHESRGGYGDDSDYSDDDDDLDAQERRHLRR